MAAGEASESGDLAGVTVLVVEDEYLVAIDHEATLLSLGCAVLGPAASIAEAMRLLDRRPVDAALLDVNLPDGLVTPVVERLARQGVPVVLASAYGVDQLPGQLRGVARHLGKPVDRRELRRALLDSVGPS
jgi:two-component system, response regulator PdtaR